MSADWRLERDGFGRLVFLDRDGRREVGVVPARAFPITAPACGLALLAADGREVAWVDDLSALPSDLRREIEAELARREFMPEILGIRSVSSFSTPSTWRIDTDRGETDLVLRGEEDIRRLGGGALLIADHHGIQYRIRDLHALDNASRRLLDRFL